MGHPAHGVQKLGQSIWYDNIRRGLITSGELHALVNEGGILGVTSNPANRRNVCRSANAIQFCLEVRDAAPREHAHAVDRLRPGSLQRPQLNR